MPTSSRATHAPGSRTNDKIDVEQDSDHPGFLDEEYRTRRRHIVAAGRLHRHGQMPPVVQYSDEENRTWAVAYAKLRAAATDHAVATFNVHLRDLERECGCAGSGASEPGLQEHETHASVCIMEPQSPRVGREHKRWRWQIWGCTGPSAAGRFGLPRRSDWLHLASRDRFFHARHQALAHFAVRVAADTWDLTRRWLQDSSRRETS